MGWYEEMERAEQEYDAKLEDEARAYQQGREDMKKDFIGMLEREFAIQNNPNSKFEETIVLKRNFIEQFKEQNRMSKQIGAREISEYAQKYNMPLGKDTPLSMEWCFEMSDKAYQQGREDAIDEFADAILNFKSDEYVNFEDIVKTISERLKNKT